MTLALRTPEFTDGVDTVLDPQIPISQMAAWCIAFRALDDFRFCLPCRFPGATPGAVERAAAIACQNVRVSAGITSGLVQEAAHRLAFRYAPIFSSLREKDPEDMLTWQVGEALVCGTEAVCAPPDQASSPVDMLSAQIIHEALSLTAAYGHDAQRRVEAQDLLTNGMHILMPI